MVDVFEDKSSPDFSIFCCRYQDSDGTPPPLPHNIVFHFYFYLEYPDQSHDQTEQCTCSISLNTFGTQLRVIEALFAEGIYMVQRGHDGPTTSGCDKMMTKDERRKRGPSESGTHAHLPKSSFQKG